jgi:hypothetical protein
MKTKSSTKQRKQARDIDVANGDLKNEFGSTYDDFDVLDEEALAQCLIDEDE